MVSTASTPTLATSHDWELSPRRQVGPARGAPAHPAHGLGGESPYFTTVTETPCDLLNAALRRWDHPPAHPLEALAVTHTPVPVSMTGEAQPRLAQAALGSTGTHVSP